MDSKRLIIVFAFILLVVVFIYGNLFLISANTGYAADVHDQTGCYLDLSSGRGEIYDSSFKKLTGVDTQLMALASPGHQNYAKLFTYIDSSRQNYLYEKSMSSKPYLIDINSAFEEDGIYLFEKTLRYYSAPIAEHTIGYINESGDGLSGVELAFNEKLKNAGSYRQVLCRTNALGKLIDGNIPSVISTQGNGSGIMLTLDSNLQRVCEGVAEGSVEKGAIIVMQTATGRIKAAVSMPRFNPNNIAQSIENNDTSLINRITSSYSVGSVFKPLLAAVALNNGYDENALYDCKGYIEVDGQVYRCAHRAGHGKVDMQRALEKSCNCYFINLGLQLGGEKIVDMARQMGFGNVTALGGGYLASKGNFPTADELINSGQLAGVSFGQGLLMATPIQIASYFNTFANNGIYISPSLVEGEINEYTQEITKSYYAPQQIEFLNAENAEKLKNMLVAVVSQGLAQGAMPNEGGAGGKTGTAQTGRFNENGEEITDAWFAGFYPAENPEYTIVVLLDSDTKTGEFASTIFAKVCNSINLYKGGY